MGKRKNKTSAKSIESGIVWFLSQEDIKGSTSRENSGLIMIDKISSSKERFNLKEEMVLRGMKKSP